MGPTTLDANTHSRRLTKYRYKVHTQTSTLLYFFFRVANTGLFPCTFTSLRSLYTVVSNLTQAFTQPDYNCAFPATPLAATSLHNLTCGERHAMCPLHQHPSNTCTVQCCFTSTETARTVRDREPRMATSTFTTRLLTSEIHTHTPALHPDISVVDDRALKTTNNLSVVYESSRNLNSTSSITVLTDTHTYTHARTHKRTEVSSITRWRTPHTLSRGPAARGAEPGEAG